MIITHIGIWHHHTRHPLPAKARRRARARQAAGAGLNGAEDDGAIGVEVDYEGVQAEDANSPDVIIVGSGGAGRSPSHWQRRVRSAIAGLSCAAVLGKCALENLQARNTECMRARGSACTWECVHVGVRARARDSDDCMTWVGWDRRGWEWIGGGE
eukprot:300081-Rhodomonas_salina.1